MPRVKSGVQTRKRRKKILKLAKGYFGSKRTLYRTANEQVMRSLNYAYVSRRLRKRDFRKLWIQRINAACKLNGFQYSKLIFGLSLANVEINRKMLADMAMYDEEGFKSVIEIAKHAIEHKDDVKPAKEEKKAAKNVEPKKVTKVEPKKVEEAKVEPKNEKQTHEIEEPVEELDAETLEGVELTADEDTEDDTDLGGADFVYHISQVKDDKSTHFKRWRVRRSGSSKTIKHFDTQKEAIVAAKRYATSNNTRIVVHGRDGQARN